MKICLQILTGKASARDKGTASARDKLISSNLHTQIVQLAHLRCYNLTLAVNFIY